jgi:exopolysaccharide biosynthesis polyprenyl glycosylphosphotransferase
VLRERAKAIMSVIMIADALLVCVSFVVAYWIRTILLPLRYPELPDLQLANFIWILFVAIPLYLLLFRFAGLYDASRTKPLFEISLAIGKPIFLGALFLGAFIFLVQAKYFSRSLLGLFLAVAYLAILSERIVIRVSQRFLRRRGFNYRTVLVVGINESGLRIADALVQEREFGFKVLGVVNGYGQESVQSKGYKVLGSIEDLPEIIDRLIVDEIIFALPVDQLARCEAQILKCEEVGLKIHIRADFAHSIFARTYLSRISDINILTLTTTPHSANDIIIKRVIDIVISVCGLVLLSPVMLIAALLIKFESRGPVLFRQVRCGLNGRRFNLLKFRSMVYDAERQKSALLELNEMSGPVFKIRNDPRVTKIGGLLRKTSLDELPQLWNVLRGDMSLVGPRPPLPSEVRHYERWQRRRLSMKPGITCLWQVKGRSAVGFEEWMKMDMEYIDNWSLGLDLKILARTIPAVLFTRGAH